MGFSRRRAWKLVRKGGFRDTLCPWVAKWPRREKPLLDLDVATSRHSAYFYAKKSGFLPVRKNRFGIRSPVWRLRPNGVAFSGTSGRAKRAPRSVRCNAWLGERGRKCFY